MHTTTTEGDRAVLAALAPLPWASDRDLRTLLTGNPDIAWGPPLAARLRRCGWIEVVRDPTSELSRAWRITDAGRDALERPTEASVPLPEPPGLTVWTWPAPGEEVWVSLERPGNPDVRGQRAPAATAKVAQTWYHAAKKARRLLAGTSPAGSDLRWPEVNLWVWREDDQVSVSAVRVPGVTPVAVPLPEDAAWADAVCGEIAHFAVAHAGLGGAVNALAELVRRQADAGRQTRAAAHEEARRADEAAAARRSSYQVTSGGSVRAILAGAPTLGRRRR